MLVGATSQGEPPNRRGGVSPPENLRTLGRAIRESPLQGVARTTQGEPTKPVGALHEAPGKFAIARKCVCKHRRNTGGVPPPALAFAKYGRGNPSPTKRKRSRLYTVIPSEAREASHSVSTEARGRGRGNVGKCAYGSLREGAPDGVGWGSTRAQHVLAFLERVVLPLDCAYSVRLLLRKIHLPRGGRLCSAKPRAR